MCGIIGYLGEKEAAPILLKGLQMLEYRGYDSAGICIINSNEMRVAKKKGKIIELSSMPEIAELAGKMGIAHTRWATHGEPNDINAHPHTDSKGNISIVHNGIIENYHSLRRLLESEGFTFKSETDSEIIANLISRFYNNDLERAVIKAVSFMEGTFGLAIVHKNENKIIAVRRGSPLVIGLGDGEMFLASDVTPIVSHTKQVIYLEDNEMAILTKDSYSIKDINGTALDKDIEEIKWNISEIEKGGFKHFMLKEIFEQPSTIANTLRGRVGNEIKISLNVDMKEIDKIILVACGTSWHSALIGKHFIERLAKIPVEVDYASEFRYRDPLLNERNLIVAISQSGETADTLAAIREAKSKGAKTAGIVNVVGSTIAREVDSGIYLHAGPEIGVASTKAFTSQVAALLLLALHIQYQKTGKVNEKIVSEIGELTNAIQIVLDSSDEIKKIAEKFKDSKNMLYLGRGLNFPTALEGALKLKEISYIHAEGYPAAEMKHGPIALIDENMPVVFICPKDEIYEKVINNMQEVKARRGKIISITDSTDEKLSKLSDYIINVPKVNDFLSPIVNAIPLQLFAYYVADLKGLDVDKPRNLAKSVTVE